MILCPSRSGIERAMARLIGTISLQRSHCFVSRYWSFVVAFDHCRKNLNFAESQVTQRVNDKISCSGGPNSTVMCSLHVNSTEFSPSVLHKAERLHGISCLVYVEAIGYRGPERFAEIYRWRRCALLCLDLSWSLWILCKGECWIEAKKVVFMANCSDAFRLDCSIWVVLSLWKQVWVSLAEDQTLGRGQCSEWCGISTVPCLQPSHVPAARFCLPYSSMFLFV